MTTDRRVRVLAALTILAVLSHVALDVVASAQAMEGYSMRRDYVSSLAARGSSVAVLGTLCLTAYAVAHALGGALMLCAWRTPFAGAFLVLAGVLFGLAVAYRADCHHGEAGCGLGDRSGVIGLEAGMHGVAAGMFALVMFATMVIAFVSAFWEWAGNRVAGFLALPLFWVSFTAIGAMDSSPSLGAWERLWLAGSAAWLVALSIGALRSPARRPD